VKSGEEKMEEGGQMASDIKNRHDHKRTLIQLGSNVGMPHQSI
jgi:hypothetical protein